MIYCIIPAHNEEGCIDEAIKSVINQVDEVLVVCDNCADNTENIAKHNGAYVTKTVGNKHKKAGALNQVLDIIVPEIEEEDNILIMDADSFLAGDFVSNAVVKLRRGYGAVGGTFVGRAAGGYVGTMQRNEFCRYGRDVRRLRGRALCLTGTATVFSGESLKHLTRMRGYVYDTEVLTEDFEVSLALQKYGYKIIAPKNCLLSTEVMESWYDLYKQRLRWKRGAVENLIQYGLTKLTLKHWCFQLLSMLGLIVTALYMVSIILAAFIGFSFYPIFLVGTAIFSLERFITVRERCLTQALLCATLIYELPYDLFLQATHVVAYIQALLNRERNW